ASRFGAGRILWGSDWPVLTMAGSYADWLAISDALLAPFGSGARNLHIVGEAYSDYQGFIEGALNSAGLALATLPAVAVDPALQEPGLGLS
ncbi:amidohydrolase family protein, partial [Chromohalobacter sp. HP20-39]|uniref:amidohydrolase family protein n=1 Tax=Chromohalobacter sp. HP20-39 TaxID=3079306 RepID=UPI00294C445C|nr:hypothetical protein [Chromohalobacter sp. HP20-39]